MARVCTQENHPLLGIMEEWNYLMTPSLRETDPTGPLLLKAYSYMVDKVELIEKDVIPFCYKIPYTSTIFTPEVDILSGFNFGKEKKCESLFFDMFEEKIRDSVCLCTDDSKVPSNESSGFCGGLLR